MKTSSKSLLENKMTFVGGATPWKLLAGFFHAMENVRERDARTGKFG